MDVWIMITVLGRGGSWLTINWTVVLQKCPAYYGQNQENQIVQNARIIDNY